MPIGLLCCLLLQLLLLECELLLAALQLFLLLLHALQGELVFQQRDVHVDGRRWAELGEDALVQFLERVSRRDEREQARIAPFDGRETTCLGSSGESPHAFRFADAGLAVCPAREVLGCLRDLLRHRLERRLLHLLVRLLHLLVRLLRKHVPLCMLPLALLGVVPEHGVLKLASCVCN